MNDLSYLPESADQPPSQPNPHPWWHKARFILPLLWLLPPIGLLLLWRGKRFSKQVKVILTVAVGLLILPRWIGSNDPHSNTKGPLNVEISVTTTVVNGLLYVDAATNLPESTQVSVSLYRAISGDEYHLSGSKPAVTNGTFKDGPFSYEGNALPAGDYELSVMVPITRVQPEPVMVIFGEKGVNLTGPLVRDDKYGGGQYAVLESIVTVNDNNSRIQLSQLITSKESFRKELAALYAELMNFKSDPYFHEIGFSPGATQFKEWQIRLEALQKQKSHSSRGTVAASELFELARDYRRSRGAETKYSEMVKPNMLSFIDDAQ